MIKRTYNKEEMPEMQDFDSVMNEVNEEISVQNAEQSIVERMQELRELSQTIADTTAALEKARAELNAALVEYRNTLNELKKTEEAINTINAKIDTINTHIDSVMVNAPEKLTLSYKFVEADVASIKEMYDKEHEWIINENKKHMHRVNKELAKANRSTIDRYEEAQGVWFGYHMQWFFLTFYLIGLFGTATAIIYIIGKLSGWF